MIQFDTAFLRFCIKKGTLSFILLFTAGFLLAGIPSIQAQDAPFVTVWQTDLEGSSDDNQITIPGTGTDYLIEWEEAGNPSNSGNETGSGSHTVTFPSVGTYQVSISGNFTRIAFNNTGDRRKILDIVQWGDITWSTMSEAFNGAVNLEISATDAPDLSGVSSMFRMFSSAESMNSEIGHWDVSNVNSMELLFFGASSFNQDISTWNTGSVTNMSGMFYSAVAFNQGIGSWDTGSVTDMSDMFRNASSFNQDISGWNTANVGDMWNMFRDATSFNQDLGSWNTGNVEIMNSMFRGATSFNGDLDGWDLINVFDMRDMFNGATSFNRDISNWNTVGVFAMDGMFLNASSFDQYIGSWDLSSIGLHPSLDMEMMLSGSGMSPRTYDNTLKGWSEQTLNSGVELGAGGLYYCNAGDERQHIIDEYNWTILDEGIQPGCPTDLDLFVTIWQTDLEGSSNNDQITIPGSGTEYLVEWEEVGNFANNGSETASGSHTLTFPNEGTFQVSISGDFERIHFNNEGDRLKILEVVQWGAIEWTSMDNAFYGASNLELSTFDSPDLSGVTSMSGMFRDAGSVDEDFGNWNVSNVSQMEQMLDGTAVTVENYDNTLSGWSDLVLQSGVTFGADGLFYCSAGDERQWIIDEYGWTIHDAGVLDACQTVPPITLVSPADEAVDMELQPTFEWESDELAESYELVVSPDQDLSGSIVHEADLTETTLSLSEDLAYETTFYWRVRGVNQGGDGDWSETRSFTTQEEPVSAPEVVDLLSPQDNAEDVPVDANFDWSASETAETYHLQVSESSSFAGFVIDEDGLNDTSYSVSEDLNHSTQYYWRVKAANEGGESDWSEVYSFSTEVATSIEENGLADQFALEQNYPNPFNPTTNIRFALEEATNVQLEVYNMLGQRVALLVDEHKPAGWHEVTFDASELSSGMYIYRIQAGQFASTKKLTLIK